MKNFDDFATYLNALQKNQKLAIIPIPEAAAAMNRTSQTINNWLRKGKLKGVSIAGKTFVLASSLHEIMVDGEKEVMAVKKRLIEMLIEGRKFVFYAEIMREFGYDYKLTPHRNEFGAILYHVSHRSHEEMEKDLGPEHGGILSSMVWRKDLEFVGDGYWGLVETLDYEKPSDDDEKEFVTTHIDRCIKYYT